MIYISLTTVPDRLNFEKSAKINILSLLNQNTDKDFRVLYNIPFKYKGKVSNKIGLLPISDEEGEIIEIPEWVTNLASENPKLIINRTKDYGPITKIVGSLLYTDKEDDILIVCDDDNEYHPDMLEYHLYKQNQYSNCAITFRGDRLCEKREWMENGKKHWIYASLCDNFPVKHDCNIAITGHWHSVSYKRSMFKENFLNEDFLFKNHWSDDIIIAYYFAKNNIEIKCVAWDNETDFRLVNYHGRSCNSFPILNTLPFELTGCHVLRYRTGVRVNDQATYPPDWVVFLLNYYSNDTVHSE